jgi:VanZ family protein
MLLKSLSITWTLVILFLCLIPINNKENSNLFWEHTDKLVHCFMYVVLVSLLLLSANSRTLKSKGVAIVVCFSIIFGMIIEVIQELMNLGRHFDFFDLLANLTGIIFALIGYFGWKKRRSLGV